MVISNTLPRPPAKRAAALALINAVSNASQIYASYMYRNRMGPRYGKFKMAFISEFEQERLTESKIVIAMVVNCLTAFIAILMATALRFVLRRLNQRLDHGELVEGAINSAIGEAEKKGFRFLT